MKQVATLSLDYNQIYSNTHLTCASVLYGNLDESKREAMNRDRYNQKANPALNTKAGNK